MGAKAEVTGKIFGGGAGLVTGSSTAKEREEGVWLN